MKQADQPKRHAAQSGHDRHRFFHKYASTAKKKGQIAKDYIRKAAQSVWLALTIIWRAARAFVGWLDAHNSFITAAATFAMAFFTYYLANYALEQGQIANRQLRIMEADQRPWIKTTLSFGSDLVYSGTQMSVTIHTIMENVGRSPALNVSGFPKLIPTMLTPLVTNYVSMLDPMKEIRSYCDYIGTSVTKITHTFPWGVIIYPDETSEADEPVSLDISGFKAELPPANVLDTTPHPAAPILVVSCVDYQASVESRHHQTADFFFLSRKRPGGSGLRDVYPLDRQNIPQTDLAFRPSNIYGTKYAN